MDPESRVSGGDAGETERELARLRSQVQALRQLLQVQEEIVGKQSDRLEEARRAAETRAAELHDSEERFDLAVRGSTDGLWDWNVLTDKVHFSPRFKELIGYQDHEMTNEFASWEAKLHPEDRAGTLAAVRAHLENRVDYDVEYRLRTKSGEYRWFRARGQAIWDESGRPTRMSGSITDIELDKRAEVALTEAKAAAEAANRGKSQFVASMSHELRTPLTGILGMTELALRTELTPLQQEYLETVEDSAESLLMLVNDILDFSKIESGKFELADVSFELRETLERTTRMLSGRARQKGLRLLCRVDPDVPDVLIGDPVRLRQVLANLVGNAIKFTPHGEVAVDVGTESKDATGVTLHIEVRDTGIGIPTERQARIFEAFSQGDPSIARTYGGTGLGLAISSQLVHEMGGRIWVESREGEGSVFHCTLTLRRRKGKVRAADSEKRVDAKPVELPPLRILLADDSEVVQKLVSGILGEKHRFVVASDGRKAVEEFAGGRFDLVLLDIEMPGLDGLEVARRIRAGEEGTGRHVPIVAMTAHALKDDRERCLAAGMDGYVSKPMRAHELQDAIAGVLSGAADGVARESESVPSESSRSSAAEAPVVDWAKALRTVAGNRRILDEIVDAFLRELPAHREALRQAVRRRREPELHAVLHTLRSSLGYLAAERALDQVLELRSSASSGDDRAQALDRLEAELTRLESALEHERPKAGSSDA